VKDLLISYEKQMRLDFKTF